MAHQQDPLDGTSIPLHCNVCPKQPSFSDVSHLLTHIASKGHLAHYYKLKIQAASDNSAQEVIDEYDNWYEHNNVQDLMGERMKQKDKRKSSGGGGTRTAQRRVSAVNTSSRNTPSVPTFNERRRQNLRESTLDPQLGPRIKTEPDSRSATPMSAYSVDPATLSRSYMPHMMQSWSTTPYDNSPTTQAASVFDSPVDSSSSEWAESEAPRRGKARRSARNLSGSNHCEVYEDDDELEFDDGLNDNTRLKGVYWDGMGMFDSATMDMRRKRNQKKAYSVVQSLMATSELVEATEMVFDEVGELHREREITGNPNEEDGLSPLKGESSPEQDSPPKKKPTRRPRPALVPKSVNTGRVLRHRSSHHPGSSKGQRQGQHYDGADDEDDLTYGLPRARKRTGLSIHRDNSGPDITFDNPASMNTLNSGFRPRQAGDGYAQSMYQDGRASFNTNNGNGNYTHQRLPSYSGNGGAGFRPTNAQNFFGQLSGQSMMQNNQYIQNPFANMMSGVGAQLAAFQQHMGGLGLGQQHTFGNDGMFHAHTQNLVQPQNA